MMIKVHSIRFRLTFYFLLIFIGLFVFVSAIVLYNFKSNAINKGRNSLRDKSFVIGAWIDFANPDFNGQVDDYIGSQEAQLMIRLYDRDKNLLGSSSGFKGDYKLLDEAAAEVESKDEPYLYESEDGLYLIAVNNLYYNDQIKGFVQLFILKDSILHNYYYLFRVILIAGIASLVIAFLAGIFLVDQMLKPINKIMDIVNKIQAEKLDKTRLEINNPHDEIGRLSSTINDLLNRIQVAISNQRKFLSDAAHELRTPLTILKGNTEVALLKKGQDAPILEKNLSEIDHLISLTNDLLLIARFDARTNVMVRNRMSMSDLVREVISNFEIKARAKNICINCDSESGIDIYADISLMKRVVYNLISNAIKYSGNGTRVEVKLYKTREDHFELVIRDEGIGIPGDKLPNIFERFYRVAEDRNKSIEGTGLGLSIVKSITDAHGFRISVESEINKGTVFVVSGSVFY